VVQFTKPTDGVAPAAAKLLSPDQRRDLALHVLAGQQSGSQTARALGVSRKFVAKQTATAQDALDNAFLPSVPADDRVLFYLPVTRLWIEQVVLGLTLIGHSSFRGAAEFCRDLLAYPIAHTTVRNIVQKAVATARDINASVDLGHVRVGALDEIFQSDQPVLVGCDAASTYCYLLSQEQHCDGDTWGVRLLELHERGFAPDATIADFGSGLRAGVQEALPATPCRGDVFHALRGLTQAASTLDNQAYHACEKHRELQAKQARHGWHHGRKDPSLAAQIGQAATAERAAVAMADDVNVLIDWLRHDILSIAGPSHAERCRLYDFVVAELRQRVPPAGELFRKACTTLANHRDELLAFAIELDERLAALAAQFHVESNLVRAVLQHQAGNPNRPDYWQRAAELQRQANGQLHAIQEAVGLLEQRTVRASSVVENLNSRLRGYFFLRRHLGPDYLEVLQFFLNHRRFVRSERAERQHQSPRELLTGHTHAHWLELLGYQRFERN